MSKKLFISLLLIVVTSLLVFFHLLEKNIHQPLNISDEQLLLVKQGESINRFSKQITTVGWLENRFWLRVYVRLNPELSAIKAGTYLIQPNITLLELLELIAKGQEHQFNITFIEGTTLREWLALLAQATLDRAYTGQ